MFATNIGLGSSPFKPLPVPSSCDSYIADDEYRENDEENHERRSFSQSSTGVPEKVMATILPRKPVGGNIEEARGRSLTKTEKPVTYSQSSQIRQSDTSTTSHRSDYSIDESVYGIELNSLVNSSPADHQRGLSGAPSSPTSNYSNSNQSSPENEKLWHRRSRSIKSNQSVDIKSLRLSRSNGYTNVVSVREHLVHSLFPSPPRMPPPAPISKLPRSRGTSLSKVYPEQQREMKEQRPLPARPAPPQPESILKSKLSNLWGTLKRRKDEPVLSEKEALARDDMASQASMLHTRQASQNLLGVLERETKSVEDHAQGQTLQKRNQVESEEILEAQNTKTTINSETVEDQLGLVHMTNHVDTTTRTTTRIDTQVRNLNEEERVFEEQHNKIVSEHREKSRSACSSQDSTISTGARSSSQTSKLVIQTTTPNETSPMTFFSLSKSSSKKLTTNEQEISVRGKLSLLSLKSPTVKSPKGRFPVNPSAEALDNATPHHTPGLPLWRKPSNILSGHSPLPLNLTKVIDKEPTSTVVPVPVASEVPPSSESDDIDDQDSGSSVTETNAAPTLPPMSFNTGSPAMVEENTSSQRDHSDDKLASQNTEPKPTLPRSATGESTPTSQPTEIVPSTHFLPSGSPWPFAAYHPANPKTTQAAPPILKDHLVCPQNHRIMIRSANECYAVACMVCEVEDWMPRWSCGTCALRICGGCMGFLAENRNRDLLVLLKRAGAEGRVAPA